MVLRGGLFGAVVLLAAHVGVAHAQSQRSSAAVKPSVAQAPITGAPPARPGALPAEEPKPIGLSLVDAVALAVRDNRAIRTGYLSRVAQRFNLRVVESRFSPILDINASYDFDQDQRPGGAAKPSRTAAWTPQVSLLAPTGARFAFDARASSVRGGNGNSNSLGYGASVVQPLLQGFGLDVNRAPVIQARLGEQINILGLYSNVSGQVTQVIQAYRGLVQAREQVGIARESLGSAVTLLAVNKELVAAGRMAANDVIETEANIASRELSLVQAQNALEAARYVLLQLLALDTSSRIEPTDELDAREVPLEFEKSLGLALRYRPDWRQQLLALEVSRLALLLAEDGQRWTLNLRAGVAADRTNNGLNRTYDRLRETDPGWNVGLVLNIPIGRLSIEQTLVSAKTDLAVNEVNLENARQGIEIEVRNAVRNVDVAWRSLILARRSRELSVQKLAIEREKLAVGRSSNFQVVSYEVETVNAKNQELSAVIGYLNSLTSLDQILGTTLITWDIDIGERVDGNAR